MGGGTGSGWADSNEGVKKDLILRIQEHIESGIYITHIVFPEKPDSGARAQNFITQAENGTYFHAFDVWRSIPEDVILAHEEDGDYVPLSERVKCEIYGQVPWMDENGEIILASALREKKEIMGPYKDPNAKPVGRINL